MKEETKKMIKRLKEEYKDDPDAMEEIVRCIIDIEYVEKKEANGDYKGQPSIGIAYGLERYLRDWH